MTQKSYVRNISNCKLFLAIACKSNAWSKSFNKQSQNIFYFVDFLFVGSCILYVKMKTFLREESVLCHNKRNCFPSYPDHYFKIHKYHCSPIANTADRSQVNHQVIYHGLQCTMGVQVTFIQNILHIKM